MTRQVNFCEWPEELLIDVDLLVGGTPCQLRRLAGQSHRTDDDQCSPDPELSGREAGPKNKEVTE